MMRRKLRSSVPSGRSTSSTASSASVPSGTGAVSQEEEEEEQEEPIPAWRSFDFTKQSLFKAIDPNPLLNFPGQNVPPKEMFTLAAHEAGICPNNLIDDFSDYKFEDLDDILEHPSLPPTAAPADPDLTAWKAARMASAKRPRHSGPWEIINKVDNSPIPEMVENSPIAGLPTSGDLIYFFKG